MPKVRGSPLTRALCAFQHLFRHMCSAKRPSPLYSQAPGCSLQGVPADATNLRQRYRIHASRLASLPLSRSSVSGSKL